MLTPYGEIDSQTLGFNEHLATVNAQLPHVTAVAPSQQRLDREQGLSVFGDLVRSDMALERTIDGPVGTIGLRLFVPEAPKGVYLHFHGGGWVVGGRDHQDSRLEALSHVTGAVVISVGYRLAPEHQYPAAPDDCEAAALWVMENARDEFGVDQIVVGGESAGAHLAAVTLLRLRDRHGVTDLAGANLVYGVFDLRLAPSTRLWGLRTLVLDTPIMAWFVEQFAAGKDLSDPDISPLMADLRGLPPALFTVGTEDPLLDDTLFMAARWQAAGNDSDLEVFPGGVHAFDAFPISIAERALARMDAFVNRCFS